MGPGVAAELVAGVVAFDLAPIASNNVLQTLDQVAGEFKLIPPAQILALVPLPDAHELQACSLHTHQVVGLRHLR